MSADKLVDSTQLDSDLTSIANAIRTKGGTAASLTFPSDFVSAINAISGGGGSTLVTKTITANGTYDASDDSADGYSEVTVSVAGGVDIPTFTVTYDNNWDNIVSVTCNKTYAECNAYYSAGSNGIAIIETTQSGSEEYGSSGVVTTGGGSTLEYTTYNIDRPVYDIVYSSNGTITVVNPSSLQGTLNATANGTYTPQGVIWTEVNVSVPTGSSGLVFEAGTYEPSADTAGEKILFANSHSEAPAFIMMVDATGTADTTSNTNMQFVWYDYYKLYGIGMPWSSSAYRYASAYYAYRATNTSALSVGGVHCSANSDNAGSGGINYPRFWTDELGFTPNSASTSRYWRAGRTYKWIAIWRQI